MHDGLIKNTEPATVQKMQKSHFKRIDQNVART